MAADPFLFWGWFIFLLLMGPVIHSIHFYLGHRLLHKRWLYLRVHALHHHNVEVGPWSGLAMHPVEHAIYFSTVIVQWLMALHPVTALFQIPLAIFNAATAHTGFERIKFSDWFTIEAVAIFTTFTTNISNATTVAVWWFWIGSLVHSTTAVKPAMLSCDSVCAPLAGRNWERSLHK